MPLVTYGKSRQQEEVIIGGAVVGMVTSAGEAGKPIVVERLDFRRNKAVLEGEFRHCGRMMSSLATARSRRTFCPTSTRREWRCAR